MIVKTPQNPTHGHAKSLSFPETHSRGSKNARWKPSRNFYRALGGRSELGHSEAQGHPDVEAHVFDAFAPAHTGTMLAHLGAQKARDEEQEPGYCPDLGRHVLKASDYFITLQALCSLSCQQPPGRLTGIRPVRNA